MRHLSHIHGVKNNNASGLAKTSRSVIIGGMDTAATPVERAIDALGGVTKTATALSIDNPSVIANWRTRGRVPAEKVLDVEAATGISRHELRPDIFGPAPQEGQAA